MKKIVCETYAEISKLAADMVSAQIKSKPSTVLGLATGSTPIGLYKNLIAMHNAGKIDFSQVVSFNLDEYVPIARDNPQSYYSFMQEKLFSHINIQKENIHIPNGQAADVEAECAAYDAELAASGGVDLQILGIGHNGHIGFNEPDKNLSLPTHYVKLTQSTINANAIHFDDPSLVPHHAITMGLGSILSAKKIVMLIAGADKAPVAAQLFGGFITTDCPATLLNLHPDTTILLDKAAAASL